MAADTRKKYGIELFLNIIVFTLLKQFKSHIDQYIIWNEKF